MVNISKSGGRLMVRAGIAKDARYLCPMLNEIIGRGGTTAMETPLSETEFTRYFLLGPDVFACHVAEDPTSGEPVGFQALTRHPELPEGWADIATFTHQRPRLPGVGTGMFAVTRSILRKLGLVAVNAAIRADNRGGLAYYEKMGFETYRTLPAIPLQNGTPVDRILKRYDVV